MSERDVIAALDAALERLRQGQPPTTWWSLPDGSVWVLVNMANVVTIQAESARRCRLTFVDNHFIVVDAELDHFRALVQP